MQRITAAKPMTAMLFAAGVLSMTALSGCSPLSIQTLDDGSVRASADTTVIGFGGTSYEFSDGEGIVLDPNITGGSFNVKISSKDGETVFEEALSNNHSIKVPAKPGEYDVSFSTFLGVSGTVDVSSYGHTQNVAYDTVDPWTPADSADQAASEAGIGSFDMPDELSLPSMSFSNASYSYSDKIAQVSYESDECSLSIRKSREDIGRDLSGEYSAYPAVWKQPLGKGEMSVHGSADRKSVGWASWDKDGFHYSAKFDANKSGKTLSLEDFKALVEAAI